MASILLLKQPTLQSRHQISVSIPHCRLATLHQQAYMSHIKVIQQADELASLPPDTQELSIQV